MTSNSSRRRSTNDLEKSNSEAYREEWQRRLCPLVPDRAGKTITACRWYHWRETNRVTFKDRKRFGNKVGLDLLAFATGRPRSCGQRDLARFEELGFVRPVKGGPYGDEYVLTLPCGVDNSIPTGIHDPTQAGFTIPTTGMHKPSFPSIPIESAREAEQRPATAPLADGERTPDEMTKEEAKRKFNELVATLKRTNRVGTKATLMSSTTASSTSEGCKGDWRRGG